MSTRQDGFHSTPRKSFDGSTHRRGLQRRGAGVHHRGLPARPVAVPRRRRRRRGGNGGALLGPPSPTFLRGGRRREAGPREPARDGVLVGVPLTRRPVLELQAGAVARGGRPRAGAGAAPAAVARGPAAAAPSAPPSAAVVAAVPPGAVVSPVSSSSAVASSTAASSPGSAPAAVVAAADAAPVVISAVAVASSVSSSSVLASSSVSSSATVSASDSVPAAAVPAAAPLPPRSARIVAGHSFRLLKRKLLSLPLFRRSPLSALGWGVVSVVRATAQQQPRPPISCLEAAAGHVIVAASRRDSVAGRTAAEMNGGGWTVKCHFSDRTGVRFMSNPTYGIPPSVLAPSFVASGKRERERAEGPR
jgi:hypothetical protein